MLKRMISTVFCFCLVLLAGYSSGCDNKANAQQKTVKKQKSAPKAKLPLAQVPQPRVKVLANLRREHPRLLFTKADQRRVEKTAAKNPLLAKMIRNLTYNAERMLTEPPVRPEKQDYGYSKVMLKQSRECLARVMTLSMAYRLGGDTRFADRAKKEMLQAAAFKDWNPRHFLDTAEMCCALAIGYDWLYDTLSQTDRATIRSAIITKALTPGMKDFFHYRRVAKRGWVYCPNNWNQVCNASLVMGALAVAEDNPTLATEVITNALYSIQNGMSVYQPDGAWLEGPGYWSYGTTYNGLMLAAMDSALGDIFGLAGAKGFVETGSYRIYTTRPNGAFFNYGDCATFADLSPVMFWLARRFNKPQYARFERQRIQDEFARHKGKYKINYGRPCRFYAMEIAWFVERSKSPGGEKLPLDAYFRGSVDIVAMHSSWSKDAIYVGFKGGDNSCSAHAHMDIGSFVLDSNRQTWAIDVGGNPYSMPGFFESGENGRRWKYYSNNSRSHNTLVIDGRIQRVKGSISKVINYLSTPTRAHAIVDMSNAYAGQAKKVLRGIAMLDRNRVLIQDEVTAPVGDVRWCMVTPADIKLDGTRATLSLNEHTLVAKILTPANARFRILSTSPPTKQENPNKGTRMLAAFVKPNGKKPIRLAILLTPIGKDWKKLPKPKLHPLNEWENSKK